MKTRNEKITDKIRGSLVGGAVGDALGYPIEFMSSKEIMRQCGEGGLTQYAYDFEDGAAVISDDTQMTLFTAEGILKSCRLTEAEKNQESGGLADEDAVIRGIYEAYLDWYKTQTSWMQPDRLEFPDSWLMNLPELHARRAPGNTCMGALGSGRMGTLEDKLNHSKGCGGVMRVAPVGLYFAPEDGISRKQIDRIGAKAAVITHGSPLGYIPGAVLVHIVNAAVFGGPKAESTLEEIVADAMDTAAELFAEEPCMEELRKLIDRAVEYSKNDRPDIENIRALGGGWVGDEALAIAIYCSLRHSDDFSAALIAAVNHSGDSDSTGAVAGNILGAWLGYDAIEEKWKKNLELHRELVEMADNLSGHALRPEYQGR